MAQKQSIVTVAGRNKQAAKMAADEALVLTHIALGSGDRIPSGGETELENEVHRGQITGSGVEGGQANAVWFDLYVANNVNTFHAQEMGLFDEDGVLFALTRFPEPVPKFGPDSSATSDNTFRIIVIFADTENVVVQLNPVSGVTADSLDQHLPWATSEEAGNKDTSNKVMQVSDAHSLFALHRDGTITGDNTEDSPLSVRTGTKDKAGLLKTGSLHHCFSALGITALPEGPEPYILVDDVSEPGIPVVYVWVCDEDGNGNGGYVDVSNDIFPCASGTKFAGFGSDFREVQSSTSTQGYRSSFPADFAASPVLSDAVRNAILDADQASHALRVSSNTTNKVTTLAIHMDPPCMLRSMLISPPAAGWNFTPQPSESYGSIIYGFGWNPGDAALTPLATMSGSYTNLIDNSPSYNVFFDIETNCAFGDFEYYIIGTNNTAAGPCAFDISRISCR